MNPDLEFKKEFLQILTEKLELIVETRPKYPIKTFVREWVRS